MPKSSDSCFYKERETWRRTDTQGGGPRDMKTERLER